MLNFAQPLFLYLLVPLALVFLVWLVTVSFRILSRPKRTYGSKYPLIGKLKLWGMFVVPSAIFMVLALARPTLSGHNVRASSGDIQIIVVLDNSISMKAEDVRPSRLEIAKREIRNLNALLREGDKVALFIFGKSSSRKLYLTKDVETFFDQVERVNFPAKLSGDESVWSTDFATALEHIYQSLDRQDAYADGYPTDKKHNPRKRSNRVVIIFSDGEDQMLNYIPSNNISTEQVTQERTEFNKQKTEYLKKRSAILAEYRKRGLRIYSVGIGTIRGSSWLSLLRDYKKGVDYQESLETEWRGQTSRLNKSNLRELASLTGVQLAGHDWTVESYQDRSLRYLESIIDSNRQLSIQFTADENSQNLWQYCLLVSVIFLVLGIATYPFKGYLRKD